jgi:hypothetical protein
MESTSQPQKKSNIPIIVVISLIVACCCGAVTLCLIVGTGIFALNRTTIPDPFPIESFDPIPTEAAEDGFEPFPTESPEKPFIPTAAVDEPYDPALPQGGRGDNALRKRVWDFVVSLAEGDADCKSPLPAAAIIEVTEEPDNSGIWEEAWTLFCDNGSTPIYRIIFTSNPDGNINFSPGLISK